jgi:hypothetical protein
VDKCDSQRPEIKGNKAHHKWKPANESNPRQGDRNECRQKWQPEENGKIAKPCTEQNRPDEYFIRREAVV